MKTVSVLVVEDDPKIAELHRRFTERIEGFTVVGIACSLDEATEMLEVLQPNLLLLDLYFPGGDSFGLLRHIRTLGLETDVILITAAREGETLKAAMRGGVFDYIIKPLSTARFAECMENYRRYLARLENTARLEQDEVDGLLHARVTTEETEEEQRRLPKGVDALTLEKVRGVFMEGAMDGGLGAEEVGARIGASRVTARRYLEYLVSVRFIRPDVVYGTIGRPERRYFKL